MSAEAEAARERRLPRPRATARRARDPGRLLVLGRPVLTALVLRSIVVPLQKLNRAVADMTAGRYETDIPAGRRDELGAMADTLRLFRESVVERRRLEEEAERQRSMISAALESITDGFVLYDAEDRILLANSKYCEMFPGDDPAGLVGRTFRSVLEAEVARKHADLDGMPPEAWIAERLAHHAQSRRVRRGDGILRPLGAHQQAAHAGRRRPSPSIPTSPSSSTARWSSRRPRATPNPPTRPRAGSSPP